LEIEDIIKENRKYIYVIDITQERRMN